MTKPRLLLLDADVIIFVHQLGVWAELVRAYDVAIPATVIEEARFFRSAGRLEPIRLGDEEQGGRIRRVEGGPAASAALLAPLDPVFVVGLHPGEIEALTVLAADPGETMIFCTGDVTAMQAAAMLDLAQACISLEAVLQQGGMARALPHLQRHLTTTALDYHLRIGRDRRITREYFRSQRIE